jgi:hypothetical protein
VTGSHATRSSLTKSATEDVFGRGALSASPVTCRSGAITRLAWSKCRRSPSRLNADARQPPLTSLRRRPGHNPNPVPTNSGVNVGNGGEQARFPSYSATRHEGRAVTGAMGCEQPSAEPP